MIRVLIVDDEDWNREIIRNFGDWEQLGMTIVGEAGDGMEGLNLVEQFSPHIVVLDMRMPGTDGVELLTLLNEKFPEVKVIIVSGYDDFVYTKHAIRCKAAEYLLKPVDPGELNAALKKCMDELATMAEERNPWSDDGITVTLTPYMQRLRIHFNEMNVEAAAATFGKLKEELSLKPLTKTKSIQIIVRELLQFLKKLMDDNSLDPASLMSMNIPGEWHTSSEAIDFLNNVYRQVMEQCIQHRKFKNRLNLKEVKHYIEERVAEPITLEQLANMFFVSKEYLSKAFKEEYGRTVTDYILQLRMDKALEWLKDENIPIKVVAEMSGYEDLSYFYRVFKKRYGISPGEMRKNKEV